MAMTNIQWTHRPGTRGETWNPVTGCTKVSQGCKHCYAEAMHTRLMKMAPHKYSTPFNQGVQLHHNLLALPLKWKGPRTVFVNSMSDLFHSGVPFAFIDQVFAVMALTPQHTYQILTKRPERMAAYFEQGPDLVNGLEALPEEIECGGYFATRRCPATDEYDTYLTEYPLPNVWLGTSAEDQATADERLPHLAKCPAAVRFVSCEPLLGPIALPHISTIDWVITGAESGRGARPCNLHWVRHLRDQCNAAGVPFFWKQHATKGIKEPTPELDGVRWKQFPATRHGQHRPATAAQPLPR